MKALRRAVSALIMSTALFTSLFVIATPALSTWLCTPQTVKGTGVCIENGVPALLITLFTPLLVGTVLIATSVVRRK